MKSAKRILRNALFAIAVVAGLWWFLADRPSPLSGLELPARALRDYIDAARRGDCAAVVAALSARSRELATAAVAGRSTLGAILLRLLASDCKATRLRDKPDPRRARVGHDRPGLRQLHV